MVDQLHPKSGSVHASLPLADPLDGEAASLVARLDGHLERMQNFA